MSFPGAAITNGHELHSLKQHEFIILHRSAGHKSKIGVTELQSRCWQRWFFLETLGENLFPCLVQLLEAAFILDSWPLPPWSKPGGACPAHSRFSLLRPVLKPGHQSQFQIQNLPHLPAARPACDRIPPRHLGWRTLIRVIFLLQNTQHSLKVCGGR